MSDYLEASAYLKWDLFFSKSSRHDINSDRFRHGEFYTLYERLRNHEDKFYDYTRMTITTFDYILNAVKTQLSKTATNFIPLTISPEQKLILTLR